MDLQINWQALMVGGCVAVGIGLARAGVQYRQKQKNDKLIKEVKYTVENLNLNSAF